MTQLILDAAEVSPLFFVLSITYLKNLKEILPSFSSLLMDPFASHVVRALLILLSPNASPSGAVEQGTVRSKKSAAWKAKQGPMRSVFLDEKGKGKEAVTQSTPPEFKDLARRIVNVLRTELGGNEVRALAANRVASPGLQVGLSILTRLKLT